MNALYGVSAAATVAAAALFGVAVRAMRRDDSPRRKVEDFRDQHATEVPPRRFRRKAPKHLRKYDDMPGHPDREPFVDADMHEAFTELADALLPDLRDRARGS